MRFVALAQSVVGAQDDPETEFPGVIENAFQGAVVCLPVARR